MILENEYMIILANFNLFYNICKVCLEKLSNYIREELEEEAGEIFWDFTKAIYVTHIYENKEGEGIILIFTSGKESLVGGWWKYMLAFLNQPKNPF